MKGTTRLTILIVLLSLCKVHAQTIGPFDPTLNFPGIDSYEFQINGQANIQCGSPNSYLNIVGNILGGHLIGYFPDDIAFVILKGDNGYFAPVYGEPLINFKHSFYNFPEGNYTLTMGVLKNVPSFWPPFFVSVFLPLPPIHFAVVRNCQDITVTCLKSTIINETCVTQNDGSVSFSYSGGQAPYTIKLNNQPVTSTDNPYQVSALKHGSYTLTVSDLYRHSSSDNCPVALIPNVTISMNNLNLPAYVCQNSPPIALTGETPTPLGSSSPLPSETAGTFSGPGIQAGNIFNPSITGTGTKTLNYSVQFSPDYATCNTSSNVKVEVLEKPPTINRVISATANPPTDLWPMDFTQAKNSNNVANLLGNNLFNTGSKGIWKSEESYVYMENRNQRTPDAASPNVGIRLDGIYDTLPLFLYNVGDMAGCYPGWRKMNTVTRNNPSSFEIENKDILGRYSSALYGYSGNLSVAVAVNAAETEIAYNGFEEFNPGDDLTPDNTSSGNLTLYTKDPQGTGFNGQLYREFQVTSATDNTLTIVASASDFNLLKGATVNVFGASMDDYANKNIYGTYSIASISPASNSITLNSFPFSAIWKGKISLALSASNSVFGLSAVPPAIVGNSSANKGLSHTGQNSLMITNQVYFDQYKLDLQENKSYVLSA